MSGALCPECRGLLELRRDGPTCPIGHSYSKEGGVLDLIADSRREALDRFSAAVRDYRQGLGKRILDERIYRELPEGPAHRELEWRLRCYDLEILHRLFAGRSAGSVLDVGSYNGWLAHRLSRMGHRVTAIDTFADPHDGLGARRFYPEASWRSIRLDLIDLSVLGERYDVVVVNRCLQFFPEPTAYFEHVRERVREGGLLVATGLDFFSDPGRKRALIAERQAAFRDRYGLDFFLRPTRGYLDRRDLERLRASGLVLERYPQLRLRNLLARVQRHRPEFWYGWWRRGKEQGGASRHG